MLLRSKGRLLRCRRPRQAALRLPLPSGRACSRRRRRHFLARAETGGAAAPCRLHGSTTRDAWVFEEG